MINYHVIKVLVALIAIVAFTSCYEEKKEKLYRIGIRLAEKRSSMYIKVAVPTRAFLKKDYTCTTVSY